MFQLDFINISTESEIIKNPVFGTGSTDDFSTVHDTFFSIFPNLAYGSFIAGIVIAIVICCLLGLSVSCKSNPIKGRFLRYSFFIVWLYGLIVYDIGMCTGEMISLVTNLPMAILYAFKIFLLDSDVSEIQDAFHHSWVYSFNFALVHFFAAIVSTLFVIKYFGFNILSKFRMWKERLRHAVDETYVFWGFNHPSETLIESIQSHYSANRSGRTYRIVIVRLNNDDDDNPETRTGFGRIFDFLSVPTSELERLQKVKCLTVGTYTNPSNINHDGDEVDMLEQHLSLKSLKRILENKTRKKIHMLFLGESEEDNLHAVTLLLKDKTLKNFVDDCKTKDPSARREVIFYSHARYNSIHRVIEDRYMWGPMRVKVVDSSHISVERLKLNEELLPVNYVKVEKDATVSSDFDSLVIGFSEVGQDSVKFLYEYGAFVKTGSTETHVERSGFHMNVVDRNMADVAGAFFANSPGVSVSVPFIPGMMKDNAPVTLNQMDCQSIEFYHNLQTWIKTVNYIVIATDNDELNITLAVRIFKLACRYRDDMEPLCILTRVHKDDDGHIREIARHYNRLLKAQNRVTDYDGKMAVQHEVKRDGDARLPIHLFGLDKDTYTYENVIDNSMDQQAVEFKERYTASTKKDYKAPRSKEEYAWYAEIRDYITHVGGDPDNYPTLSAVMGIYRKQEQDRANCFHATTKKILTRKALKKNNADEDFNWPSLTRKQKTIEYQTTEKTSVPDRIIRILNVLAQTEHLRWSASHEILGYVGRGEVPERNEVRKYHSCIRDWQDLSRQIQSYDFDIVDMTLGIINPERPIENND